MANTTGLIVLTWKNRSSTPPLFYQLAICRLESRNKFLLDWIWKYRCTARTGEDLYYLVFIDHFILHVYPLL